MSGPDSSDQQSVSTALGGGSLLKQAIKIKPANLKLKIAGNEKLPDGQGSKLIGISNVGRLNLKSLPGRKNVVIKPGSIIANHQFNTAANPQPKGFQNEPCEA